MKWNINYHELTINSFTIYEFTICEIMMYDL